MGATNHTTNYNLPQFVGSDKPTWLGDVNGALLAIDTQMKANETASATADTKADTALTNASSAQTTANTASTTATTADTTANSALNKALANEADIVNLKTANTYSTNETVCGVWINGKTIYRKVIEFGTLPNNNNKTVHSGITWHDVHVTNLYGVAVDEGDTGLAYPMNFANPGALSEQIGMRTTGTDEVKVWTGTNRSVLVGYVIIEYTKNSDV